MTANENSEFPYEMIDAINQQCYDARADYWDRMPFAEFLPKAVTRACRRPRDRASKALDIGSGTGKFALWLKQQGFDVLCLDPSLEMAKRCRALGLETLQTTVQEFSTLEQFDLVAAILSLIHVPKMQIREQLKRIAGWTRPDGLFVLAVIEGSGEGIGELNSGYPRFFSYYSKEEVLSLAAADFICIDEYQSGKYLVFIFRAIP